MSLKIKYQPEDFIVEELATLPLKKIGLYGVYRLVKRGWNTMDALREIAKMAKLSVGNFAYGGRKDRHSLSTQFITVKGNPIADLQKEGLGVQFVGFMDRPMGPDLIEGNRFEIAVRNLAEAQASQAKEESLVVAGQGLVNYFDDQRFGGYDERQGFLAERILKKQFNGAVKTYLTSIYSHDKTAEKKRRQFFSEHWKEWEACRKTAVTSFEKFTFDHLAVHPTDFLSVLERIPKEDLSMALSAYQSFLWNELVRRLIKEKGKTFISVPGDAGEYLFFRDLSAADMEYFCNLQIPTVSAKVNQSYEQILQEREIKSNMFNKLKIRQAFFKSTDRPVIIKPRELEAEIVDDEFHPNHKKLCLKFILPRGCYATMFLKRILAQ